MTLDNAIRQTNRRVNALEYVIQPKIRNTIRYIQSELGNKRLWLSAVCCSLLNQIVFFRYFHCVDERDREEFFRLKKVQDKKKLAIDRQKEEMEARMKLRGVDVDSVDENQEQSILGGVLSQQDDPEVVF